MSDVKDKAEQIEGLGSDEDSSFGEYPIDTVLIRNENRTVHDVLRRIEKGSFIMNPDFQRDFVWDEDKQSKLIESVLMRIPLPVFYLAENLEGRMIVVDGLQRLSTFQRFVADKLKLKLPHQSELDGKTFSTLSPKLQNRVEDCNLILYLIDAKVPQRALLDIFERVNSGAPLTRQQMRNCLFMGKGTAFLKQEASTSIFREATGKSLESNTMRDREFVNRFCAFYLMGAKEYRGEMDNFLGKALEKMNEATDESLSVVSSDFRRSLKNNMVLFGKHAFRRHTQDQMKRCPPNASLWDVLSTGLARYQEDMVKARKTAFLEGYYALMEDPEFIDSITRATNDVKWVQYRFACADQLFKEVFNC